MIENPHMLIYNKREIDGEVNDEKIRKKEIKAR